MRIIKLIFFSLTIGLLSSCNMNSMAEKMVPAHILEKNDAVIENVLVANANYFTEFDEAEFDKAKAYFEDNTSKGKVLRQDFVGINSSTGISTEEGKSRKIDLSVELQTEQGFTLISTQYRLDAEGKCCALVNVSAQKFESSPVRAGFETLMKVMKGVGVVLLIGLVGLVVFLVRRSRRKKSELSMQS